MSAPWFDQLEGRWQLRRRIVDLSGHMKADDTGVVAAATTSLSGRLAGMATFTRIDAASMAYMETGELLLRDGTRLKAVRRYVYRMETDGACVIEFADGPDSGRRFLRFSQALSENAAEKAAAEASGSWTVADDHLCGRDLYQAEYRFLNFTTGPSAAQACEKPVLLQRTLVSGPRKDYAIVSRLQR